MRLEILVWFESLRFLLPKVDGVLIETVSVVSFISFPYFYKIYVRRVSRRTRYIEDEEMLEFGEFDIDGCVDLLDYDANEKLVGIYWVEDVYVIPCEVEDSKECLESVNDNYELWEIRFEFSEKVPYASSMYILVKLVTYYLDFIG